MKEDKELHNDDAATNEPRLHASSFTPSESRTTNIPPRLPVGFSYDSPAPAATGFTAAPDAAADEQLEGQPEEAVAAAEAASPSAATPEPAPIAEMHPDMPADDAPLCTEEPMVARRKQPRRKKHTSHTARRVGAWCKRYALWVLLVVVVAGVAATYQLWTPLLGGWGHNEESAPVIAADTLPKAKPVVSDTMVNTLTHEDSMRIQDSVRHARWLYWQRRQRQQQQNADEQAAAEAENEAATATQGASAAAGEHPATHPAHTDSLH